MANYDKKLLNGEGLNHLIDELDVRYAVNIDFQTEELEYLGVTYGSDVISLPDSFTELICISSLNPWNNVTFSIPAMALHDDSPVTADSGVEGGYYYKTGSYVGVSSSSIYADCCSYLISKTKAKLYQWFHNEDSVDGYDTTYLATTNWYYRVKRDVTTDTGSEHESISNATIDSWWNN